MVGISGRSKGCINCRRRKIKCGAEKPACLRCVTSRRTCEGYEPDVGHFINYGAQRQVVTQQQRQAHQPTVPSRSPSSTSDGSHHQSPAVDFSAPLELNFFFENPPRPENPASQPQQEFVCQFLGDDESSTISSNRTQDWTSSPLSSIADDVAVDSRSLMIEASQLARQQKRRSENSYQQFIYANSIRRFPIAQQDKIAASWVGWMDNHLPIHWHYAFRGFGNLLPNRVGVSPALDEAMQAVATCVFVPIADTSAFPESLHHYARAVTFLRQTMQNKDTCRSSEVLCATVLLQIFEVAKQRTGVSGLSWVAHAGGATRLVELRGPRAHVSGLERAVLVWLRATIIAQAMKDRRRCFLSQESWREALDGPIPDAGITLTPSGLFILDAFEDLLDCATELPGILEDSAELLSSSTAITDISALGSLARGVLTEAHASRLRCKKWRNKYLNSDEHPEQTSTLEVAYDNPIIAYFDAIILMLLVASDGTIYTVSEKIQEMFPLEPGERARVELESREALLDEVRDGGRSMKWAYTMASAQAAAPLRLLDLAFDGLLPMLDLLPADVAEIVRSARLSEEQRRRLLEPGIPTPPHTP